jgi:hypothetical protein
VRSTARVEIWDLDGERLEEKLKKHCVHTLTHSKPKVYTSLQYLKGLIEEVELIRGSVDLGTSELQVKSPFPVYQAAMSSSSKE